MILKVIFIVTLWGHYHQLIFILGGIYSMQLKGNEGKRGKRTIASSQTGDLLKKKTPINNNKAQRGEIL